MQDSRFNAMLNQLPLIPLRSVTFALGELYSISEEQLRAQWSESRFEKIPLHIRLIRAEQQCMVCFGKYHPSQKETACPTCGSVGAKILAGEEFYLESIEEENE